MSELTKQYFDKQLNKLATKEDIKDVKVLVKTEVGRLDKKIETEVGKLKTKIETEVGKLETKIETEVAELARMTANGFEEIKSELNVKKKVENLDRRMFHVEQALNIKN